MSEQQFRVIADRGKGDDPQVSDLNNGDRATVIVMNDDPADDLVVRIERPVPATDETKRVPEASCFRTEPHGPHYWGQYQGDKYTKHCLGLGSERAQHSPRPPTREQIAEVLWRNEDPARHNRDFIEADPLTRADHLESADAVLALIRNGADR